MNILLKFVNIYASLNQMKPASLLGSFLRVFFLAAWHIPHPQQLVVARHTLALLTLTIHSQTCRFPPQVAPLDVSMDHPDTFWR